MVIYRKKICPAVTSSGQVVSWIYKESMIQIRKRLRFANAFILALFSIFFTAVNFAHADAASKVTIYFFWSVGCPHCEKEEVFLGKLGKEYPELDIRSFEVKNNPENARLFSELADAYGVRIKGVPVTFIGGLEPISGYSSDESTGQEIEEMIKRCVADECVDPLARLSSRRGTAPLLPGGLTGITGQQGVCPQGAECPEEKTPHPDVSQEQGGRAGRLHTPEQATGRDATVKLPLVGEIKIAGNSLVYQTIVIAGLDGFNPCAFFVLFTLLGILLHVQSRKKLLLVGGIFVFFSGLIYFIFMAAWLNIFLFTSEIAGLTAVAGTVAVGFAFINIKDFFYHRKGISLVIPDKAKPGLYARMRKLVKTTSLPSVFLGTVVLAAAANTYELFCTAGFPMVYTRILTLQNLPKAQYYFYLVFYNVIYVIPLTLIVLFFVVTLGARKLSELQGQILKLISGVMMLCLGAVLLIKPQLLNNAALSAGLLGISIAAAGVIIFSTGRLSTER